MKKLAYSILIIFAALFAVDRLGGLAMKWVFAHSNDVLAPKLCYIEKGVEEDVVLMGASRCHHHYLPSVIGDTLGMSVYNAGIGGANNIYSHYIVLCHLLQRHAPKVVCMEVMPTDYCQQDDAFSVVSFFAPLFGNCKAADSIYYLAGSHWKYQLSHLYRYNAKASSNVWGLVLNRQGGGELGYIPLPRPNQFPTEAEAEAKEETVDSLKLHYLQRFINLCRQGHIQLVWMVSPKLTKVSPSHYDVLKSLAQANGIPFLDYHTRGLYLDHPEYFKDSSHLWDEGAKVFSSLFAHDLKECLKQMIDNYEQ